MPPRMLMTGAGCADIEPLRTSIKQKSGRPLQLSARQCIKTIRYLACSGKPQRHPPKAVDHWDAVDNLLRRWEAPGIWRQRDERLQIEGGKLSTPVFIDHTIMHAQWYVAEGRKTAARKRHRRLDAFGVAFSPESIQTVQTRRPVWPVSAALYPAIRRRFSRWFLSSARRCRSCHQESWTERITVISLASSSSKAHHPA
jgi:type II secretory pathway component PulJ